ncbi:ribosomal protein S7 domain-containing protein [Aspergillus unguis]
MPPRLNLFAARSAIPAPVLRQQCASQQRALASIRTSTRTQSVQSSSLGIQRRWNSRSADKSQEELEEQQRTAESMPHVSEEAAEINRIVNKEKWCDGKPTSPELEHGTPVQEILSRDKEAKKHAPKVFQNELNKGPSGSRSFSTSARRYQLEGQSQVPGDGAKSLSDAEQAALLESMINKATEDKLELLPGLKYEMPEALPPTGNFRKRYEPVVEQFTKNLMRHGKLAVAQKNMAIILDVLRTSPAPQVSPRRPLLPGPPTPQLPLDPIAYLTLIVDSVAPLIKITSRSGLEGGGRSTQVPAALTQHQRRGQAIRWIIDSSDKRKDTKVAHRVANELIAVAEGRSGVWEKRENVHKIGIAGRVFVGAKKVMKRKKI